MCRMLIASGRFRAADFVDAVRRMSQGCGASDRQHHDGWGAVAVMRGGDALLVSRSAAPISACPGSDVLRAVEASALAVHARSASRESQRGLEYTHPIETRIAGELNWFFHNGYCPRVNRLLGCEDSAWDSQMLLDWLTPAFLASDWRAALRERLSQLPEGSTAANCIFVSARRVVVCNWFDAAAGDADYYTMHANVTDTLTVVASEPFELPSHREAWTPLGHGSIVEWPLENGLREGRI